MKRFGAISGLRARLGSVWPHPNRGFPRARAELSSHARLTSSISTPRHGGVAFKRIQVVAEPAFRTKRPQSRVLGMFKGATAWPCEYRKTFEKPVVTSTVISQHETLLG